MVYYLSDAIRDGGDPEFADLVISSVKRLLGQDDGGDAGREGEEIISGQ